MTIGQRLSQWLLPPVLVIAALAMYRVVVIRPVPDQVVPPRSEPWVITPQQTEPRIATDEQLAEVLNRVTPPTDKEAMTNNFVHALRLWGPQADFHDPKIPTGNELRQYILDDAEFRKFAGHQAEPLFYYGHDGLNVRSFDERIAHRPSSSFHTDDLLATLAETGTPLDTTLRLRGGDEATVRELLNDSLRRFHPERFEYEWTAIVYGRYVFPLRQWKNKYGTRIDADLLVDELVTPAHGLGPCNGLHRLEALAVLYRADQQAQVLSPRTKRRMLQYMKRVSDLLVTSQSPEGFWDRNWPTGKTTPQDKQLSVYDKLLVTGHQLEWLALAPDDVQPPRETIVRAGQWLVRTLTEMDQKDIVKAYGPYSHAARALCLWRGVEPYDAWLAGQAGQSPAGQTSAGPAPAGQTNAPAHGG
jgi:hypothetical protein